MAQKNILTPVININISKGDLIKALQFRFNMINENSTIEIITNGVYVWYTPSFLGCNIISKIFLSYEWVDGLLKRHFMDVDLSKYKLHAVNDIGGTLKNHYNVTFILGKF